MQVTVESMDSGELVLILHFVAVSLDVLPAHFLPAFYLVVLLLYTLEGLL